MSHLSTPVTPHTGGDGEVLQEVQVNSRPVLSLVAISVLRSVDNPGTLWLHLDLNDVKCEEQPCKQTLSDTQLCIADSSLTKVMSGSSMVVTPTSVD